MKDMPTLPQALALRTMKQGNELRWINDGKTAGKLKSERIPAAVIRGLVTKKWIELDREEIEYRILMSVYKITDNGKGLLRKLDL